LPLPQKRPYPSARFLTTSAQVSACLDSQTVAASPAVSAHSPATAAAAARSIASRRRRGCCCWGLCVCVCVSVCVCVCVCVFVEAAGDKGTGCRRPHIQAQTPLNQQSNLHRCVKLHVRRAAYAGGRRLFTGRFRAANWKLFGPSSGPGTSPDVSGSFCCTFWWYVQLRSSVLDPFCDTFVCQVFASSGHQHSALLKHSVCQLDAKLH
jgi:hypothetical protein